MQAQIYLWVIIMLYYGLIPLFIKIKLQFVLHFHGISDQTVYYQYLMYSIMIEQTQIIGLIYTRVVDS